MLKALLNLFIYFFQNATNEKINRVCTSFFIDLPNALNTTCVLTIRLKHALNKHFTTQRLHILGGRAPTTAVSIHNCL